MYQRILVPIDGSPTSWRGLEEAIQVALPGHASLRLIHVVDELSIMVSADAMGAMAGEVLTSLIQGGHALLADAKAKVEARGLPVDVTLIESMAGRVCDHVIAEAARWQADLIVIGTHGRRGVGRFLLGSDAEQILRLAPTPVLLVRAAQETPASPG
jgi:nucleotide-binding universal stress UspA family protein